MRCVPNITAARASKPPPPRGRPPAASISHQRLGADMACLRRSAGALLFEVSTIALLAGLGTPFASVPASAQVSQTLDPITVVASKTEETVIQALAGVSAVRQDQINQLQPTRTSDVFFGMPSVWFQQRADDPGTAINIRGMQDFGRVAVVIDGARQNFQRTGHNADGLFYLEPELLAGVDVVRGPVANIYGSGAIGGVVSFRTKDVDDILKPGEKFGGLLHGLLGSNQVQGLGSVFLAARPSDKCGLHGGGDRPPRVGLQGRPRPRWSPNSHFNVSTEIAKLNFRPAEGHERQVRRHPLRDQLSSTACRTRPTPRPCYATEVFNDIATARWRYTKPDDRLFNFDINTYWTKTKTDQTKVDGTNGSPSSGSIGDQRSFQIETIGFDANNTSRFDLGPFQNAAHRRRRCVSATRSMWSIRIGTGDFFTPSGERTVSGAFAQLKANYSTWLSSSARPATTATSSRAAMPAAAPATASLRKATVGITPIIVVHALRHLCGRLPGARDHRSVRHRRSTQSGAGIEFRLPAEPRAASRDRQDQGGRHQHPSGRALRRQRCAAHQGQCVPQRRDRLHRADLGAQRPAGPGRPVSAPRRPGSASSTRTFRRRASRASSSKAPTTPAAGSSASPAPICAARTSPRTSRC